MPWNLPFQPFVGRATNTLTRHPVGGCVTVALTRQDPSAALSSTESMVVFGSETLVRLSCGITGALSAKAGLGGASPTWARATAAGSATRTVSIPMRCRARPNVVGKGHCKRSSYVRWDHLGCSLMKHSTVYESSVAEAFGNLPSSPAYLSPAFLKAEPSSMNFRC